MSVDFDFSALTAKRFGLLPDSFRTEDKDRFQIKVISIKENEKEVVVNAEITTGEKSKKKLENITYQVENISSEKATFLGWAFILSCKDNGGLFSYEKISEEEKKSARESAEKFLDIAIKEDKKFESKIKSCLPYYLICKYRLYDFKDSAKTDLYKALNCSDVLADAYEVMIEMENYSLKKVLIAKQGLEKFPTNEKLIREIADYHIAHSEHKKALNLILSKKKVISKEDWKEYKALRILLIFSLIKLQRFDEAREETKNPVCYDFEKDSDLFLKGFIEYESKNYKKAIEYFLDTIQIANYDSSAIRASYYFLMGCYDNLGQISRLEELIREFELAGDYFYVDGLWWDGYVDYARKILKNALEAELEDVIKAKINGLLAFSYYREIETNIRNPGLRKRALYKKGLTKKEMREIKNCLLLMKDTLKYYPTLPFFNALYANLCNLIGNYGEAVKFSLKALKNKNDNDRLEDFRHTELKKCPKDFIENYSHCLRENVGDVDKYIEEKFDSDIDSLYEMKEYAVISKIYFYLKNQGKLNKIWEAEEDSYAGFLFRLAYSLNNAGYIKDSSIVYKKHIEFYEEDSHVLNNLALIREKEGNLKEAKRLITRAKKLAKESDEIVDRNYDRLISNPKKIQIFPETIEKEPQENSKKSPQTLVEKDLGYFKFQKQGQKIKIGQSNSRHFRLLQFLSSPIDTSVALKIKQTSLFLELFRKYL